jgi:L-seryl-tRNA(Ser) seleniumtransferase
MVQSELRRLPSVDKVISHEKISQLREIYPHGLLLDLIRKRLDQERASIMQGNPCPSMDEIIHSVTEGVTALALPSLKPVINASGVIVHTNLGRAPLSEESMTAMRLISGGYCNLEIDLESNTRGSRHVHIEQLLCQLTGAEAALVVNNNAAAVLLALTSLAKRKEVIVSRGQAVEIGGGFRIPDVMKQSSAKLIEVGTTNCTYDYDYEQAISPRTIALLRVHPSNFRIEGFTHVVTLEEMVALGDKHNIPVLDDLGSGCFLDPITFGLAPEPLVQDSISAGVGLAFFSGDKLVGGPQAGIIVGRKYYVDRLKKHALARALRIDKIRLAGLAATLVHYLKGEAVKKIPVWRMIASPLDEVESRARLWLQPVHHLARLVEGETMLGGGSLPGISLPTRLVAINGTGKRQDRNAAHLLSRQLRNYDPPVIGRVSDDILYLDPRTVLPEEDEVVIRALGDVSSGLR